MLRNRAVEALLRSGLRRGMNIVAQGGQVGRVDGRSLTENDRSLDQVLQFTHVSGPGIGHEFSQHILAELQLGRFVLQRELFEKVLRQ